MTATEDGPTQIFLLNFAFFIWYALLQPQDSLSTVKHIYRQVSCELNIVFMLHCYIQWFSLPCELYISVMIKEFWVQRRLLECATSPSQINLKLPVMKTRIIFLGRCYLAVWKEELERIHFAVDWGNLIGWRTTNLNNNTWFQAYLIDQPVTMFKIQIGAILINEIAE